MEQGLWKKDTLQQRINKRRSTWFLRRRPLCGEQGKISFFVGLYFALFFAVILYASIQIQRMRAASLYLEDALAASNLGAAMVDLREYGRSHQILVESPEKSYETFQRLLRKNLNLDENFLPMSGTVLGDKVEIRSFAVYNVEPDKLTEYYFDKHGNVYVTDFPKDMFYAPNWQIVEYTSIYSEVETRVECFPGIYVKAKKGKLVEVVNETVR